MKTKLVIVALILIGVSLFGICYNDYKNHKTVVVDQKAINASLKKELTEQRTANDKLVAQYNTQVAQCKNGAAAYGILTPAEKTAAAKGGVILPVCGIPIVQ